MTHSHLDHVGAIEPLKEVYPDLKVIVHETEAPFLIGGDEYSCYDYLPGGLSPGFKLLMTLRFIPPYYQYKVGGAPPSRRSYSCVRPGLVTCIARLLHSLQPSSTCLKPMSRQQH